MYLEKRHYTLYGRSLCLSKQDFTFFIQNFPTNCSKLRKLFRFQYITHSTKNVENGLVCILHALRRSRNGKIGNFHSKNFQNSFPKWKHPIGEKSHFWKFEKGKILPFLKTSKCYVQLDCPVDIIKLDHLVSLYTS